MAVEPIGTMLVVEDDEELRQLTVLHGETLGFKVFEAPDGQVALALAMQELPDVIVSDMKMPIMDGMTLLKELRERGIQSPFLFISAFTTKDYTVRALSLGAFDYLEKPFTPNELKALVHEMLRVSRAQKRALLKMGTTYMPAGVVSPEAEIIRLSTLSADDPPISLDHQTTASADRSARLVRLFAMEVQSQLSHGLKALTNLKHSDAPSWELGYLFRLMYSISSTATSLHLDVIRDLSKAMEQTYVLLRVRTSYLNKLTLGTLQVAHDLLRRHVDVLDGSTPLGPDELAALHEETKNIIKDLKSVALNK